MRYNTSLITDLQSSDIPRNINIDSRRIDINYRGYDSRKALKNFVLSGVNADANRVLFWLSSKRDDYVRSYLKGGVLYELLGEIANSDNLDYWKGEISRRFNDEFSGEMNLLYIDLDIDKKRKTLRIGMMVQDRLLGVTFPVNTEAGI